MRLRITSWDFSFAAVSRPSNRIFPELGASRRSMSRMRVVLPLPLGPIRVKISPLLISRSIPFRISRLPNLRERPDIAIMPVGIPP
jgi:hypothetical protein